MKLVDILARELKVWPDQYYQIYQDSGGCLIGTLSNGDLEDFDMDDLPFDPVTIAWDGNNAVIERAEWQAAVDALNAPKVVEWDGDRLPPTGTVCEHFGTADHTNWIEVQVIGHGHVRFHDVAFFEYMSGTREHTVSYSTANNFRPIRTAEQVAAEEIQDIEIWLDANIEELGEIAKTLHKSGFRKQVAK